jgi:large subunit ribosomal protein L10
MPTPKKIEQVAKIKQLVEKSGGVYFADFSKLGASEVSGLRRKLKKENIRLVVAKNRLTKRALTEAGVSEDLAAIMRGPTSMILGPIEEPYGPGRRLKELLDRYKECQFKGAYVEKTLYTSAQFAVLAAMPTRPELHGQLVGVLQSPIYQLVATLDGIISGLVFTLDELKGQREKAVVAAAPAAPEESSKETDVVAVPEPGPVEEKKPDA